MPITTQSTKDYTRFAKLRTNREVDEGHVNTLIKSFEENGNFTQAQPIIVNENMEVIDGQHRLEASKRRNDRVYYTVVPGLRAEEARQMNILQRGWTPLDYMKSYAEQGLQPYLDLLQLHEEYPEANYTILRYFSVGSFKSGVNASFRRGEFPEFDMDEARERLDHLMHLAEASPAFHRSRLAEAVLGAMRTADYNKERMVAKVKQRNGDIVVYQDTSNNLRQLETIFNHGYSEMNRARFF